MSDQVRAEFNISGRVQGVGFRFFVIERARRLNMSGYVSNNIDGTVEVVAEGDQQDINTLHEYLKQGPMMAHVENCKVTTKESTGEFRGFDVR